MTCIQRIPTKSLDEKLHPLIDKIPRHQAFDLVGKPQSTFDRAKEALFEMQNQGIAPKGFNHEFRRRVYYRQTLEVINQYLQLVDYFGTVNDAIANIHEHMEIFWHERENQRSY